MVPRIRFGLPVDGFEALHLAQWALYAVIVGALVTTGWFWWTGKELEAMALQYEAATERVKVGNRQYLKEAAKAGFDVSEQRVKTLGRDVTFINQLLEKRAFSWTRLLTDLEEAVPLRVTISSVTMNFKDSTITLNGTALTIRDVTLLANGLEGHAAFRNAVLSHHQFQEKPGTSQPGGGAKESGKEGLKGVDFSMTVTYSPPVQPRERSSPS